MRAEPNVGSRCVVVRSSDTIKNVSAHGLTAVLCNTSLAEWTRTLKADVEKSSMWTAVGPLLVSAYALLTTKFDCLENMLLSG